MLVYLSCFFTCQLCDLSQNFPRRTPPPQITVFFFRTKKNIDNIPHSWLSPCRMAKCAASNSRSNVEYLISRVVCSFLLKTPRERQTPLVLCSRTPPIATMEASTVSKVGASSTGWIRSVASASAFLEAVNAFSIYGVHTRDARHLRPARAACIGTSISATCGTKR